MQICLQNTVTDQSESSVPEILLKRIYFYVFDFQLSLVCNVVV